MYEGYLLGLALSIADGSDQLVGHLFLGHLVQINGNLVTIGHDLDVLSNTGSYIYGPLYRVRSGAN